MSEYKPWYEDEEFWEWTEPMMFSPAKWLEAADSVGDVMALLNASAPASILDLCSGPGRFTIPLAMAGFEMTAVDRTRLHMDELRNRAREHRLNIEAVSCDMREFRRPDSFDFALNVMTSFGYFEDPADDRRVLENVHASLRNGGRLLIDVDGREPLIRTYQKQDWIEIGDITVLAERVFHDNFTKLRNRWILFKNGERREWRFDLRVYGAVDLCELLSSVGFRSVDTYGDFKGTAYDMQARRLVVVATK